MGIVRFALRYQHTFYVLALLMLFLGGSAIVATPKDVFPSINIPVVTVIWQYTGLTPEEMEALRKWCFGENIRPLIAASARGWAQRVPPAHRKRRIIDWIIEREAKMWIPEDG